MSVVSLLHYTHNYNTLINLHNCTRITLYYIRSKTNYTFNSGTDLRLKLNELRSL